MSKGKKLLEEAESAIYIPGESLIGNEEELLWKGEELTWIGDDTAMLVGLFYIAARYSNICLPIERRIPRLGADSLIGIIWSCDMVHEERRLNLPKNFIDRFKKCVNKETKRFIAIMLLLSDREKCREKRLFGPGHANILIYDRKENTIYRIEPLNITKEFEIDELNKTLMNFFKNEFGITYETAFPSSNLRPQYLELNEGLGITYSKFCAAWSLWILALKASNPNEDIKDLLTLSISKIEKKEKISLYQFIKNYAAFLIKFTYSIMERFNERIGRDALPTHPNPPGLYLWSQFISADEAQIWTNVFEEELQRIVTLYNN